jgi:hypothetical protein
VDRLEKRIAELEQYAETSTGRAPEWRITSEEALQIFDILAEAGAVEVVLLHDWQSLSNEFIQQENTLCFTNN